MSHIAYQPKGEKVALEADYVVVGSGAGGSSAAVTLARAGEKVAIVEAGPWRDPQDLPHSMYGTMRDLMDNRGNGVAVGTAIWPVVQASCVGGTTVINSAICVRTPGDIFDLWRKEYGVGYGSMERTMMEAQDRIGHELSAVPVPRASWGRSNELAHEARQAAQHSREHDDPLCKRLRRFWSVFAGLQRRPQTEHQS